MAFIVKHHLNQEGGSVATSHWVIGKQLEAAEERAEETTRNLVVCHFEASGYKFLKLSKAFNIICL